MKKVYISPSQQFANEYAWGNTTEGEQCQRIGAATETALKRCGFEVMRAVNGTKYVDTIIPEANRWKPDLYLPIHTNAGGGQGTVVLVYDTADAVSMQYATAILEELCAITLSGQNRGVKARPDLLEINSTSSQCVYVEVDFHDNAAIAQWIVTHTEDIAEALCRGCCKALGVEYIPPVTLGDVNGDGKMNAADATRILLSSVDKVELTEAEKAAADVNGDGKVNAADAAKILAASVGKVELG